MAERRVTIASSVGLHARPAALFTQAASRQPVAVAIGKADTETVDARSMLLVMTLNAQHGDEVILRADGEGAEAALDELAALLSRDLDAPEGA